MSDSREPLVALRWTPVNAGDQSNVHFPPMTNPEGWTKILDACTEHRPWYSDPQWEEGPEARRFYANEYIIKSWMAGGLVWDVWRGDEVIGLLLIESVRPNVDAYGHFIFFDHELHGKQALCLSALDRAFQEYSLEVVRAEIPTYANSLAGWVRKALGFKYDAEWLGASERQAKKYSRRYHICLYKGHWTDGIQLSLPRDHFYHEVTRDERTKDDDALHPRSPSGSPSGGSLRGSAGSDAGDLPTRDGAGSVAVPAEPRQ